MQSVFRPLAPAPPGGPPGGPPEPSSSEPRKRKKKARLACNHCRLKRIGCDGARPDCTHATPTMALKNEVETLQRRLQEHTDFIEAIRNAPDDEVLTIVHRLRSTENLSAAISTYQGRIGGPSLLSEHASARAAMPSTETGIEFEITDHPVLGFFDADLFLRDLIGQGLNFCSSFLFHSVMSLACQSYSTLDLRVTPFVTLFIEESVKLWHAERSIDATTTLAAINCLSVATGWNGKNELGNHQLVTDARAMAARMQLLDVAPTDAFRASFFPKPSIRYQPNFPIPGDKFDIFETSDVFEPAHQAPA
ncbi:hypothetical protein E8E11_008967 [Didymella keratinophila]|nr:hypothetical protein E8E11_008967 [Didymella keratinophila]